MNYFRRVLIALDQLGNAITGGDQDSTISGRIGYNALRSGRYWRVLEAVVDWTFEPIDGPGHCFCAAMDEADEHHYGVGYLSGAALLVLTVVACAAISLVLRWRVTAPMALIVGVIYGTN